MIGFFPDIDISPCIVEYDRLHIETSTSLDEQFCSIIDQNLFLIAFDDYALHLGWYDIYQQKPCFGLHLIKDCDWDDPLLFLKTRNTDILKSAIIYCIEIVRTEIAKRSRP